VQVAEDTGQTEDTVGTGPDTAVLVWKAGSNAWVGLSGGAVPGTNTEPTQQASLLHHS
jgi:hypothetical protein